MTKFLNISTDTTLGGNAPSDELAVSQKAIKTYVDNHGGGGSIDAIDNLTITKNSDDEIQTVATVNQNTASGATNPVYDWVGTLAEYTAQDIENQHPDWVCYITDDIDGGTSVYTKSEVDTLLTGKVDTGHEVIEYQAPTSDNNYTWYRKYADGWVEQGGLDTGNDTITLPITMVNNKYTLICALNQQDNSSLSITSYSITTTSFYCRTTYQNEPYNYKFSWQVSGIAAS